MKKDNILFALYNYFVFFILVAFIITCSTMLFVSTLSENLSVTITSENVSAAAKITFWNVLLLTLILTVCDAVRRRLTVARPIKHITEAAEKIMQGDFSVRISPVSRIAASNGFNEIIDCINRISKELESVETLRCDFVANVSHEMKTPLAVIKNYGTLLQAPDISYEKRIEYAKGVTEGSRRLSDMMTNMLKLNRLENQQIYPNPEKYDLGEQLCECLLSYENIWEESEIEIETDIAENITVTADRELLSIIWNNLFSNAFKFTPKGGRVKTELSKDGEYALVKVSDTGCGMSPEEGAHIFEKFYQADRSRAAQGNGLGLALVKRVVDIVQGEISVESAVGEGSTFTVKIKIS